MNHVKGHGFNFIRPLPLSYSKKEIHFKMNRVLSTILLTLYLIVLLRPAAPLFDYAVNLEYIASELCINKEKPQSTCNGKCYLNSELEQAQNLNESEQKSTAPKIEVETPSLESLSATYLVFPDGAKSIGLFHTNPSFQIKEYSIDVPTPPPELNC